MEMNQIQWGRKWPVGQQFQNPDQHIRYSFKKKKKSTTDGYFPPKNWESVFEIPWTTPPSGIMTNYKAENMESLDHANEREV